MQQVAAEIARFAVEQRELVNQSRFVIARSPRAQQPQLVVGVPATAALSSPEELIVARNPVACIGDREQVIGNRRRVRDDRPCPLFPVPYNLADLVPQLVSEALVG